MAPSADHRLAQDMIPLARKIHREQGAPATWGRGAAPWQQVCNRCDRDARRGRASLNGELWRTHLDDACMVLLQSIL